MCGCLYTYDGGGKAEWVYVFLTASNAFLTLGGTPSFSQLFHNNQSIVHTALLLLFSRRTNY